MLVGAEGRTVVHASDGAAYLYTRDSGGSAFTLTKEFLPQGLRAGSSFGAQIALAGDVAACADLDGTVILFARNAGGADHWGEERRLTFAPTPSGPALALDHDRLVVGVPSVDGLSVGAVYVHERNLGGAGRWGRRKELLDPITGGLFFGSMLALSGDTLFVTRLPVGVAMDDPLTGAVLIYERNQSGANAWGAVQTLVSPEGVTNDMFGPASVDGARAVVGAYFGHGFTGVAYLYQRATSGPNPWQLVHTFTGHASLFGHTVAIEGDLVVVGSELDPQLVPSRSSAHVFVRNLGGTDAWGSLATLAPSALLEPGFLSSDLSGGTVLGADFREGQSTGAAYTFDVARAANVARNGAGTNRACYSSATPPRLGGAWLGTADARAHPGALATLLMARERGGAGHFVSAGEILLDLTSPRLFAGVAGVVSGSSSFAMNLPNDPALIGFAFSSQVAILGGGSELCNALDLVLGP